MTKSPVCPVCNSTSSRLHFSGRATRPHWNDGHRWNVQECNSCSHGFISPVPCQQELDRYYSNAYAPYATDHGVKRAIDDIVQEAKAKGQYRHVQVRPGLRILDVGCGGGSFMTICQALGATVQGVEPSAEGVEACRANNVPVFHGSLTEFVETGEQKFDLITASHVLEHHSDPILLLNEMRSCLQPGGNIWFAVPNAGCYFSRSLKDQWHSCDLPVHLQHFSLQSVAVALKAAGLRTMRIRTESENSLPESLALLLKVRFKMPARLTSLLVRSILKKDGWLGRRLDSNGQGEAILVDAMAAPVPS